MKPDRKAQFGAFNIKGKTKLLWQPKLTQSVIDEVELFSN